MKLLIGILLPVIHVVFKMSSDIMLTAGDSGAELVKAFTVWVQFLRCQEDCAVTMMEQFWTAFLE